jgi:hypothetical protein
MLRSGLLFVALLVLTPPPAAEAAPTDDAFVAGYATAVLEREFKATPRSLAVSDGVVFLTEEDLAGADQTRVMAALSSLRGVREVRIAAAAPAAARAPAPTATADPLTAAPSKPEALDTGFLPPGHLFDPLLADPRWPHFFASYQHYLRDRDFTDVASVGFGETIVGYRGDGPLGGQWEAGLQAGVFAIFDLDASSKDLLNADYFVGLMGDYKLEGVQAMGRVFHRSSHLGDEFLLRNSSIGRVNLSYEAADVKLSYHLLHGRLGPRFDRAVRVYVGGGRLFDQEPSDLKPWSTQVGLELESPWTLWRTVRPVAAVDVENHEQNKWSTDVSVRAGLAFESLKVLDRKLVLLFEYFSGNSPNGQFYRNRIEYTGAGLHFYY